MNLVLETIKNRRSIRHFLPSQVSNEELSQILDAGIWAPSGHNDQPWHFTIIQKKEIIDMISDKTVSLMKKSPVDWVRRMGEKEGFHIYYNAPTIIIISGKKNEDSLLKPIADCSAAIENMLLAAESLNVGTCWIGFSGFFFAAATPEELKIIGVPEGYEPFYSIAMGYKDPDRHYGAPRRKENTITYIR